MLLWQRGWIGSLVKAMSTAQNPTESSTVLRRRKDGTRVPVQCPVMIRDYNNKMGGGGHRWSISWVQQAEDQVQKILHVHFLFPHWCCHNEQLHPVQEVLYLSQNEVSQGVPPEACKTADRQLQLQEVTRSLLFPSTNTPALTLSCTKPTGKKRSVQVLPTQKGQTLHGIVTNARSGFVTMVILLQTAFWPGTNVSSNAAHGYPFPPPVYSTPLYIHSALSCNTYPHLSLSLPTHSHVISPAE